MIASLLRRLAGGARDDLPELPLSVAQKLLQQGGYEACGPRFAQWYMQLAAAANERGLSRLTETFLRASQRERHPEMNPLQQPVDLYVPGLGQAPFFEREGFPFMAELERRHPAIKAELLALRKRPKFTRYAASLAGNDWLSFHFYEAGHRFDEECALCPETTRAIESIPGFDGGLVGFFAIAPGGRIGGHHGVHNAKVRVSMGITGCEGAFIEVGGQVRQWQEGVCLGFDDSYLHRVWHDGNSTRFVLLMDVWHPGLSAGEVEMLDHYYTTSPMRALWLAGLKGETPVDNRRWWMSR